MTLPTDSKERKEIPLQRGCYDYFPLALAAVAKLSKAGNDKHKPGQPLHWSREESSDHADCIARHQQERGTIDPDDGFLHDVKVAWRALAQCQIAEEKRLASSAPSAFSLIGEERRVGQRRKTPFSSRPTGGWQRMRTSTLDGWVERRKNLTFPAPAVVPKPDALFNACHDYGVKS